MAGAVNQIERLEKVTAWLSRRCPLACRKNFGLMVESVLYSCPEGNDAGTRRRFSVPQCVLRSGGLTVDWPVNQAIEQHRPYDTESFPDKRVSVAVVCPREFVGEQRSFSRN